MPRAPGPLPPWAREIVAALRFLGQHLARLRHQLGRQLAKVARRGPKIEQLDKMKAEHPDWSLRKIGETCQRRWGQLGDEAKAPYVELAQADAKRYKAEAAAYLAKM